MSAPAMPIVSAQPGQDRRPGKKRALVSGIIIFSVFAHVVALVLFGLWVVAKYFQEPAAVFEMKPEVRIPPQPPEHRLNMAKHQAMAPKPVMKKRLVSTRPSAISLPELPPVDVDQALVMDTNPLQGLNAASLAGAAGFGNSTGLTGGGGTGSGMSFFGIRDKGQSVVIMIDVSTSMFSRTGDYDFGTNKLVRTGREQKFQRIRDEAMALVDGLDVNARFGIIRWSGSARAWKEELVPATDENKRLAKEHIQDEVDANSAKPQGGRPGGTRHDYALEELFKLDPEIAFMLTDGNATRSVPGGGLDVIEEKELTDMVEKQKEAKGRVPKIHTIYYVNADDKREEERMLRSIARASGGETRKVKAEGGR
ncbi:MAG: vWA domain-containing protein [Verrucomicrobiales bacterium]